MTEGRGFRALANFEVPELRSAYAAGLTYTIRPGNERLAEFAADWAARGLIEYLEGPSPTAIVAGVAEVVRI